MQRHNTDKQHWTCSIYHDQCSVVPCDYCDSSGSLTSPTLVTGHVQQTFARSNWTGGHGATALNWIIHTWRLFWTYACLRVSSSKPSFCHAFVVVQPQQAPVGVEDSRPRFQLHIHPAQPPHIFTRPWIPMHMPFHMLWRCCDGPPLELDTIPPHRPPRLPRQASSATPLHRTLGLPPRAVPQLSHVGYRI